MIRVLLDVPAPAPGTLTVTGERHHYLTHVLRLEPGDAVEVFDGRGRSFPARIERIEAGALELSLGAERTDAPERRVTIVQGLPKGDKLEWIIEKGTELGAAAFVPVSSDHAVVKLDAERAEKKRGRWQKIAEEAARQCRRNDVPAVLPVSELAGIRAVLEPGTLLLILDEAEEARRLGTVALGPDQPVALVVGPEGGLSRAEVDALIREGGLPVTLGRNILRTETAALAALAVLRHRDGLLG